MTITIFSNKSIATIVERLPRSYLYLRDRLSLRSESASFNSFIMTLTRAVWTLRREPFDAVYDLEFFANISAVVSFLSTAPIRAGFINPRNPSAARRALYTHTVKFRESEHAVMNFLRLANPGASISFARFRLTNVDRFTAGRSFPVVLNINAGPLAFERRWSLDNFRQLAEHLTEVHRAYIFLVGSVDQRKYVKQFQSILNTGSVTNYCGKLTISELVQLIRSSHLLVTNDSGPLHIASALNIPIISFFGPEIPRRYGSLSDRQLTFYAGIWCSPCMTVSNLKTVNCINDTRCMKQIRFPDIKSSVDEFVISLKESRREAEKADLLRTMP